jgi:hypothetical protein
MHPYLTRIGVRPLPPIPLWKQLTDYLVCCLIAGLLWCVGLLMGDPRDGC